MIERKKRLKEVYDHLRANYGIHTQGDFANSIQYSRVYISAAMNGTEKYLTDKLFTNICEAYPGVFNIDYLLTGEGNLLATEKDVTIQGFEKTARIIDQSSLVNAALAAKCETIESLKRELQTKDDLIESLRAQIEEKNDHISTLKERLVEYRKIIDAHNGFDFSFPIRASEKPEKRQINK